MKLGWWAFGGLELETVVDKEILPNAKSHWV